MLCKALENVPFWIEAVCVWIDARYYDWIVIRIKGAPL